MVLKGPVCAQIHIGVLTSTKMQEKLNFPWNDKSAKCHSMIEYWSALNMKKILKHARAWGKKLQGIMLK